MEPLHSAYTAKLSQTPGETKRQNSLWLDIPTGSVRLADVLMHLSRHLRTDTERCKSELQGGDFYLIAASHLRFSKHKLICVKTAGAKS